MAKEIRCGGCGSTDVDVTAPPVIKCNRCGSYLHQPAEGKGQTEVIGAVPSQLAVAVRFLRWIGGVGEEGAYLTMEGGLIIQAWSEVSQPLSRAAILDRNAGHLRGKVLRFGLHCPPYILTSLEDAVEGIEQQTEALATKLGVSVADLFKKVERSNLVLARRISLALWAEVEERKDRWSTMESWQTGYDAAWTAYHNLEEVHDGLEAMLR